MKLQFHPYFSAVKIKSLKLKKSWDKLHIARSTIYLSDIYKVLSYYSGKELSLKLRQMSKFHWVWYNLTSDPITFLPEGVVLGCWNFAWRFNILLGTTSEGVKTPWKVLRISWNVWTLIRKCSKKVSSPPDTSAIVFPLVLMRGRVEG